MALADNAQPDGANGNPFHELPILALGQVLRIDKNANT
jgi:hypothetical protein